MQNAAQQAENLDNEFVWGANAIAEFLNVDRPSVYLMVKNGELSSVRKVNRQLVSTRAGLRRDILGE